jgi:hypothetical protein
LPLIHGIWADGSLGGADREAPVAAGLLDETGRRREAA